MKKIQEKLSETIEKQSFNSIDRLAESLDTVDNENTEMSDDDDNNNNIGVNATETVNERECTGENKVMFIGRSKRKLKYSYRMKATERGNTTTGKDKNSQPKPKPRYHCSF
jgi:hypothetical protein